MNKQEAIMPEPSVPTAESDPARYTKWLYGVEEVSSHTGLSPQTVTSEIIFSAKREGYQDADYVLFLRRWDVRKLPDNMRAQVWIQKHIQTQTEM